jgi:ubiquinone/menaquinone biosynthesis C-methylase UbiE
VSGKLKNPKMEQRGFYDIRYSKVQRALHRLHNLPMVYYDTRLIELMLETLGKPGGEPLAILDVGSGQGIDAILLSRKVGQVVGIDISREAVRTAKILIRNEHVFGELSFIVGDAENLPFKTDAFDAVYCKDALHHVSNSMRTLIEMKRVARDRGQVMAVEANAINPQMIAIGMIYFSIDKGVFRNTRGKLQNLFLSAGLSRVNVIETEFLPRHMLFEYRSPLNIILKRDFPILEMLRKIEEHWQKHAFLREFSNYLVVTGSKTK